MGLWNLGPYRHTPGILVRPGFLLLLWLVVASWSGVAAGSLSISEISDNRLDYLGARIPRHSKLEITFQIENTVARNLQLPFDSEPPPGVEPGVGITVNAHFTPDNWKTTYTQPAFLYQEFQDEVRSGQEWFYPTDNFSWKVRFAPHEEGRWKYVITAEDAGGSTESVEGSFFVSQSNHRGFIRVSQRDTRYFEFDDGTYFPALGYNMNYDHVSWRNPLLDNEENFRIMGENGIQLIRMWLSQWSIYGTEWNPWNAQDPALHAGYLPHTGITFEESYANSEVSMKVAAETSPCMFIGVWKARPAVHRNSRYRVSVRYKTKGLNGALIPGKPFGFVVKTGDWLWSEKEENRCYSPGTGTPLTAHQSTNTNGWKTVEGWLESGNKDFMPNLFLVMENADGGSAFVDFVAVQEDLGGGNLGPNIVSKPWMAHHLYFEQRNSYAFDKLLDLAATHGVYLRPVVHEKHDRILNRIGYDGQLGVTGFENNLFYGDWRNETKVRWHQKSWWRYLQARWGHSPQIHSWELLNEGDPFNGMHHTLADEFGKYMHQFAPNDHLVSTSTWHSFPKSDFWTNPNYPNIDFADVHLYIRRDSERQLRIDDQGYLVHGAADYIDAAVVTKGLSDVIGGMSAHAPGKPILRGETGFVTGGSGPADSELESDTGGVWLHNFIWGGVNPGGVIESYWYEASHIVSDNHDGTYNFDHRPHFGAYYRFIQNVPLNNGYYQDAEPWTDSLDLRVWGQKDLANGRAHLWIQNRNHIWGNVVRKAVQLRPISATIRVSGFNTGDGYLVEWWDTYRGEVVRRERLTADRFGSLVLRTTDLENDIAVRIGDYSGRSDGTRKGPGKWNRRPRH